MCQNWHHRISIHALLAESDFNGLAKDSCGLNFYPRSPCGERRAVACCIVKSNGISIHALLAESDNTDDRVHS